MDSLAPDRHIHVARADYARGNNHLRPLVLRLGVPCRYAAQFDDRLAQIVCEGAADRRRLYEVAEIKILSAGRLAGDFPAWAESSGVVRSVFVLLSERGHRSLPHGK